jgi:acyl carrier protein
MRMAEQSVAAVANEVERFIRRRFEISDRDTYFDREVNLWDGGYVDSIGMTELLTFLESTFGMAIPATALLSPDFATVGGIARLVVQVANGGAEAVGPPGSTHLRRDGPNAARPN